LMPETLLAVHTQCLFLWNQVYIGDDTKGAAHRSPNYITKTKKTRSMER